MSESKHPRCDHHESLYGRCTACGMTWAEQAKVKVDAIVAGTQGFAADMRAQGIHVGMGRNPVCVTCGEPWPCAAESASSEQTHVHP